MIGLMISVARVTGTQDPKVVVSSDQGHLILIIALHPFYLNPYDNVAQGLREYSSETIYTHCAINHVTQ